jgi:protein phosphatase
MSTWTQLTPSTHHRLAFGPAYGMTDVGAVRRSNEDNFLIDPALSLVAVADGMGGHDGGEVAAYLALCALRDALQEAGLASAACPASAGAGPDTAWPDDPMRSIAATHRALDHANAEVYGANARAGHAEGEGMGATLTGFWQSPGGLLVVFHVGDSRLYRLRGGKLALLTRDQTMYQQALDAGVTGDYPPRNLLLQAVGPTGAIYPDVKAVETRPGDLYMVCSDGLYGTVPHEAIAGTMAGAGARTLDRCCEALIELAKQHGSRDNITAVLALVEH